jgi:hypothetical protein
MYIQLFFFFLFILRWSDSSPCIDQRLHNGNVYYYIIIIIIIIIDRLCGRGATWKEK